MDTLAITVIAAIVLVAGILVERVLTPLRVRRAPRKLLENTRTIPVPSRIRNTAVSKRARIA